MFLFLKGTIKSYLNLKEPKEAIKVKVVEGKSDFIIPNQYDRTKHMTNAFNIDWSRIVNPITYY